MIDRYKKELKKNYRKELKKLSDDIEQAENKVKFLKNEYNLTKELYNEELIKQNKVFCKDCDLFLPLNDIDSDDPWNDYGICRLRTSIYLNKNTKIKVVKGHDKDCLKGV